MREVKATSRIQNLFKQYMTILRRNGLPWIINDNQKVAVQHVLSQMRPTSLQNLLESDFNFSNYDLRKDCKGFMSYCVRLSEPFQLVDNCKPRTDSTLTDS